MTTMLSLILAFMLSIGGSPATSVNPAGCPGDIGIQVTVDNNRTINRFLGDYNQKTASRANLKKILEIPLIKKPKTQIRLRFTLYLKEELRLMGYIDSMNLYQGFNMNPINFTDPFGLVIHVWENLGVYGPASWKPDRPVPYKLFTYDESGAYARFKDSIKIEPVHRPDGKWTIRASFKMTVLIWLTNRSKLEHEKAHIVQYMNLYMRILRFLEKIEKAADKTPYKTKESAQETIDRMAGKDYSEIKKMTIETYNMANVHDKMTRQQANRIINKTNYFEMKKTTDPPFKARKFEEVKTWADYILGTKEEKKEEEEKDEN